MQLTPVPVEVCSLLDPLFSQAYDEDISIEKDITRGRSAHEADLAYQRRALCKCK